MLLVISGVKSKKMVTFSDRLVVLHSLQASVDEITEEIGLCVQKMVITAATFKSLLLSSLK